MKLKVLHRHFLSYVIPTVLAMFISGVYQVIDGIFVGNYVGESGLAGVNMGWSFIVLFLGYGLAVGVGIGSLFSIACGEEDIRKAKMILGQGGVLIVLPSIILGIIMYLSAPFLVDFMHASDETREFAIEFIQIFSIGAVGIVGSIAMPFIVRNLDSPNRATLYMAIGAGMNIAASFVFVVLFGWEIRGAVFANIIGETIAMLLGVRFVFSKHNEYTLVLNDFIPKWSLIKQILINGSSGFFMYIYVGFIMLLHQKMLIKYGSNTDLAIYAVLGYIMTIYYLVAEGIANGSQPIMSELYGKRNYHSLRAVVRMTLLSCLGVGVFCTLLLQIFPGFFANFFLQSHDIGLRDHTVRAIHINLSLLFLEGIFVVAAMFFESLGEGIKALWITILNLLLQVPFLWILPKFLGVDGVWLTAPIAYVVLLMPIGWMMLRRYRSLQYARDL